MFKKGIKKVVAVVAATTMLVAGSVVTYAAYEQSSGYAGSVYVTGEVGMSGTRGYAWASGTDNVDARMSGEARYYDDGELKTKYHSGGFDQNTYGEYGFNCKTAIEIINCNFRIISDDGEWNKLSYAYR